MCHALLKICGISFKLSANPKRAHWHKGSNLREIYRDWTLQISPCITQVQVPLHKLQSDHLRRIPNWIDRLGELVDLSVGHDLPAIKPVPKAQTLSSGLHVIEKRLFAGRDHFLNHSMKPNGFTSCTSSGP